jgi:hypothetical protein
MSSNPGLPATLPGNAKWDANTRIVISKLDAGGLSYEDKMTLSTCKAVVELFVPILVRL